jgi:twinkle protein
MKLKGYISGTPIEAEILERNGKQKCPVCPTVGKKNIKDTPLSVSLQKKLFKCHKCGWVGGWGESEAQQYKPKEYKTPVITNQTDLKLEHLQSFSKRLITQEVLIRNKVRSSTKGNWFAFTYYNGDKPVKVKYKTPDKQMMQSPDSMPWVYKYNDLIDQKEVMVCEGEEEALIWEVAGFNNACSVDMGAPNPNDVNVDAKLQCLTNCFDAFEEAETIYLAVDNDVNGVRLEKELIKRFGAEKCKIIDFSPYKDANEYALHNTPKDLLRLKEQAKDVQIDGIFRANDFKNDILRDWKEGQPKGTTTYFTDLDPHWTWRLGEVNIWSGYNNEGKSLFLKQIQIAKSLGDGWKHAIFSPEEWPVNEWYTDVIESYIGKSADKDQAQYNNYMSEDEALKGIDFANDYFYNVYPDQDHSIDEILKLFSYTVRKHNIKTVTLDPYNQVHHKMNPGEREDLYISRFMAKLKKFAIDHMVSFNLIAHQSTPMISTGENYPEPNMYKIKGGGTFSDKADNVLAVWRENRNTDHKCTMVKVISQKIKKQKLTGIPGTAKLKFDRFKNRYKTVFDKEPLADLQQQNAYQEQISYYEKEKEYKDVEDDFLQEREPAF